MSGDPIAAFAAGAPEVAAASALAGIAEAALLALVARLADQAQRGHLEAIAESQLPRKVRKAAGRAAYRLKSAGVAGTAQRRVAAVALPEDVIDPGRAALTVPPGLYGRFFFLLGSLAGTHAVEVRTGEQAELEDIERLAPTSTAKLSRLVDQMGDSGAQGMPFLAGIDLAARLLDGLSEEVRRGGGRFPQEWTDVVQWRHAAAKLGADPDRASARRGLAGRLRAPDRELDATAGLITAPLAGPSVPPGLIVADLADDAVTEAEQRSQFDEVGWRAHLHALADRHCDRWLGHKGVTERAARLLELTADTAWVRADEETALGLLQVSDALTRGTRGSRIGLLRAAFRRLIDEGAAAAPRDLGPGPLPQSPPHSK